MLDTLLHYGYMVLDGHQVGADGRPEGAARAVHVRVHQLVYEPDRVRGVQHTHQEDAGDAGCRRVSGHSKSSHMAQVNHAVESQS